MAMTRLKTQETQELNAYFLPEGFIIEDGIGLPMSSADPLHAWQKAFEADKVTTLFHLGFLNKEKWLKSKRKIADQDILDNLGCKGG